MSNKVVRAAFIFGGIAALVGAWNFIFAASIIKDNPDAFSEWAWYPSVGYVGGGLLGLIGVVLIVFSGRLSVWAVQKRAQEARRG